MIYNKADLLKNIKSSWLTILDNEELNKIITYLNSINTSDLILPYQNNIFKAFTYFELKKTKLVILGQDPYHNIKNNIPQANGLAFSVNEDFSIPPSLRNIYKELKNEYPDFNIPSHGNLSRWVKEENILLLNTSLTVVAHSSASHMKLWEKYTNNIIKYISENVNNVIFLLFGNFAKKKFKLINKNRIENNYIKVLNCVHPSPLSANRGFFNSNIFIECNNYIKLQNNLKKVNFMINNNLNLKIIKLIFKIIDTNIICWNI